MVTPICQLHCSFGLVVGLAYILCGLLAGISEVTSKIDEHTLTYPLRLLILGFFPKATFLFDGLFLLIWKSLLKGYPYLMF